MMQRIIFIELEGQPELRKKGEAITFINPKQIKKFMKIEKLIDKVIPKLDLPQGFKSGPKYVVIKKKI